MAALKFEIQNGVPIVTYKLGAQSMLERGNVLQLWSVLREHCGVRVAPAPIAARRAFVLLGILNQSTEHNSDPPHIQLYVLDGIYQIEFFIPTHNDP